MILEPSTHRKSIPKRFLPYIINKLLILLFFYCSKNRQLAQKQLIFSNYVVHYSTFSQLFHRILWRILDPLNFH